MNPNQSRALTLWSVLAATLMGCGQPATFIGVGARSGGATTVDDLSTTAFSGPAANLNPSRQSLFNFGHTLFKRNWVTAPATTEGMDGLGPRFIARSCSGCHANDGRGAPPLKAGDAFDALLFRLSLPGTDAVGGPLGDPVYGTQLETRAILGVSADATPRLTLTERSAKYGDGAAYSLAAPSYSFHDWSYGPPAAELMVSPRVAGALVGLGLLEAVPEAEIRKREDPGDANGDGIRGHANLVADGSSAHLAMGRFGWKANQPTVEQQIAAALVADMGITSRLHPSENCTDLQASCRAAASGGDAPGAPEISDDKFAALVLYMRTLGVPARRGADEQPVKQGEELFAKFGCVSCHTPTLQTGEVSDLPELSSQTIHPFTDLLLHDMGESLADGRPDFAASGQEWRTPALWGIGLIPSINGHDRYLHDGRARGLAEAVLWHGGEAALAREAFRNTSKSDRDAVIAFLNSL